MKKLCIYYSLSGNGDVVADTLKSEGYDIKKVITKKKMPDLFFLRILVGGYKAMVGYKEGLEDINVDINDYDKIVIASPIWNDRLSSPIRTVLDKFDFNNKDLCFVLYSGSGNSNKASEFISSNYPNSKIINLKEPKKNSNVLEKLRGI